MKEILNKVKDILSNKKNLIVIGIIALLVIIAIVIMVSFTGTSKEEKMTNRLKQLGIEYYEDFYYPQLGSTDKERADFVKGFAEYGIKVNLDNLSRYKAENNDILKEFVNSKNETCDIENTKAIIYPEKPYAKNSYRIEVELVCDKEEK